jgi:hypothetical protein
MEYERLTAKNADYEAFIERVAGMSYLEYVQKCINKEKVEMPCVILKYMLKMHERLADLEDKIENGTLIELPCKDLAAFPCKMGETVWLIYKRYWNVADKNGFWVLMESKVSPHNKKRFNNDFGKFVFLTREEADKRLKELQNEHEL